MYRVPRKISIPLLAAWGYGVLYYTANRAVYYPMKYPRGAWTLQGALQAEDVWLTSAGNIRLHAWWIPAANAGVATLFLHGNAGNITHRYEHARLIRQAGSALLLLDYRGYGRSQGRPTENGLYQDAEAGYQYLLDRGYPPQRIVVHGESLGTAVAVELASRHSCAGVVLEAPFTSAAEVAGRILPLLGPLLVRGFDSLQRIGRVKAPLLFLHGDSDATIPFDLGRKLFEAAPKPKTFWRLAGADHNDLVSVAGPGYTERLKAFYAALDK
jgi:fermentation-respiration switch protein FrsA (DUF1100 family)